MKYRFYILIIILLSMLGGCGKDSSYTIKNIDGVMHVINSSHPISPSKEVRFESNLVINGISEDGEIILYKPSRFTVDHNENIYILDNAECNIKKFDKSGKLISIIGKNGAGPGEFYTFSRIKYIPEIGLLVS
ncbi:6-bladed beta-propeller [bacterium]|nr:6-bladed beta-propeller [bacterium]